MRYQVQYTEIKPGGTRASQDIALDCSYAEIWDHLGGYEVTDVTIIEFAQSDSLGRVVFPVSD